MILKDIGIFGFIQTGLETFLWTEVVIVAPVVAVMALWIIYLIKQNSALVKLHESEKSQWSEEKKISIDEKKELNAVIKEMTDVIDRAYNAIESGNLNLMYSIKNEADIIKSKIDTLQTIINLKK